MSEPKTKPERKVISTWVDVKMLAALNEVSESTHISKARLLDKAIELLYAHFTETGTVVFMRKE